MLDSILKFIARIFTKKNKELYRSTTGFAEGSSVTVPNISKYSVIAVNLYVNDRIAPVICYRQGNYFVGGNTTPNITNKYFHATICVCLLLTGDKVKNELSDIELHRAGSNHNDGVSRPIFKIVGLELLLNGGGQ